MFSSGPNYNKLKINLNLVTKRLKMLEKKKTELSQKARKEIADYLKAKSADRARIKVEQIIREDYIVEAMEILEMYCDLLLARFGVIQQMKTIDEGLAEAISSIIWAAPRMQADVAELQVIADQLTMKYGKQYGQACRDSAVATISPKLQQKLGVQAPPRHIVEKYLVEIAKHYGIEYEPEIVDTGELIDFAEGRNNLGGGGWSAPPQPGFKVSNYPEMPSMGQPVPMLPPTENKPFHYPNISNIDPSAPEMSKYQPPRSSVDYQPNSAPQRPIGLDQPPPYQTFDARSKQDALPFKSHPGTNPEQKIEKPSSQDTKGVLPPKVDDDDLLSLPSVPLDDLPSFAADAEQKDENDPDEFDAIMKRFEDLKKRKN
ncbi:IST1 homolog [Artemia franciscana]|uniref:IST1 homolog n=1 Tax=Artemia franciscana TaxID=6661 RepID=A0AA88HSC6_ARTSF|nr:hypothetical protein QYM36_010111 [Artemia franciscana]